MHLVHPPGAPFQSHAGSIEALEQAKAQLRLRARFNPTLVRLRPGLPEQAERRAAHPFQSHAGSIEAAARCWTRRGGPDVSIPRWFD